ncbi:glycosyltransferase family 4 protein [Vibrio coralliirubri]|uniref:glycosyltransferase family 4 protein n=1 Tax=Vibrio coralliirubri TaxID=1516159 RepID=UPI00062FA4FA|nr:glycosyltransferase family 4 protein [Vibrio coralliirubri]CDU11568.1 putative Glycosyl transferase group 1 [Vibrio coralliirubri]
MMKTYLFTDRLGAHSIWSLLDSIAAKLIDDGHNVIYCRFDDNKQGYARDVPDGVVTYDVKVPSKKYVWDLYRQHRAFSKALVIIINRHNVDLVHTNFAIPAISARLTAKKCGVAVVSTQHELYGSMSPHLQLGLRWTEKLCRHIVYISHTVAESFSADNLDENNESIILNGIDVDGISTHIKPFTQRHRYRIICAGRMVPVKGQHLLLEALPAIIKVQPDIELLFAGSGPEEKKLEVRSKQLGIEQHVTFMGWLSREKTMDIISSATVMAIPSDGTQEGFGLVVAEALALEVPIVCSDIPVFKEVAGETALLFKTGDSVSLANALLQVIQNPEVAQKRVHKGKQRVVERFRVEDMVAVYIKLYQRLLGTSK